MTITLRHADGRETIHRDIAQLDAGNCREITLFPLFEDTVTLVGFSVRRIDCLSGHVYLEEDPS
ncbi:hypothetical protein JHL17_26805 [Azospirillum sp. YIM B02556]|uniref:DUF2283 domain-containing protein n=1 Tax=Azospirillum endophyticum TaxID=2800326 RepID=A0ABS1FC57_9PROT|nr:hypothetical protein [Azospirillum endophyticum]MBK1841018.1 hypothetical protein [Azospirillum endophyticum]